MTTNIKPTDVVRLYRIWNSIIFRCTNPKSKQYKNYGGRGISVCKEWLDFNQFFEDVWDGSKSNLHLDRMDNDKGYSKENCRWVTPKQNHRNKRNNHYYQTHLRKMTQAELIETIGYTRKQFRRVIEKYGEEKFLELFRLNSLPKKRAVPDLKELIGKKFGNLTILRLDDDKSTGSRYFCKCDCGKETRIARFKILHGIAIHCNSCAKRGDKNPNSIKRKKDRTLDCDCN